MVFALVVGIAVLLIAIYRIMRAWVQANYPSSWKWRLALFAPGFAMGISIMLAIMISAEVPVRDGLTMIGLWGIFIGIMSAFVFPIAVRSAYPKR
jgi:hypothetical protein